VCNVVLANGQKLGWPGDRRQQAHLRPVQQPVCCLNAFTQWHTVGGVHHLDDVLAVQHADTEATLRRRKPHQPHKYPCSASVA